MLELKGPLFHSTLNYVKNHLGEEKYDAFVKTLPEELKIFLSRSILSSKYYPASLLVEITDSFIQSAGIDSESTYVDIGRRSADEGFRGIYKIFLKVGSPLMMIRSARNVYKSYYSQGEMQVETREGKSAMIRIVGSGIDHMALCSRMSGFIERTMFLSGGKHISLNHTKCFAAGDEFEEWIGSWG